MHSTEEKLKAFERLLEIMDELREKCPWDREQTLESLRNLTIEETYELADAIMDQDLEEIRKELGRPDACILYSIQKSDLRKVPLMLPMC